ncbi:S8 family peptidase [Streptomyces sp. enrichment culture]|uniref:S8 family peptidase n=1 Tax=Streptomyces sp. enrichment culture TaxID=1795815 RepID=UPI003F57385B
MPGQVKRACAAAVATAAAVALTAGMTVPAASGERAATPAAAAGSSPAAARHVTLITGDRVAVDAEGRVVGLRRAEGRERIPVRISTSGGRTLVIPADAAPLVASGRLDRRLFDLTELAGKAAGTSQQRGLKVIVGYRGAARAAKAEVRDAGTLRRTLTTLNADAVQTPPENAADLWDAVTDGEGTASGISRVWLDGVRKASLDTSVAQIGTPKAWAAGHDGTGVRIAVLDTGVDTTHPDLRNQVVAEKNFSASPGTGDRSGHGTHVASTAAGTGAKSGGTFKGVAPGAKILNGKVLDDEGFGDDSGILAGMEWAAAQGADIVNMSLGGPDGPETDPLEAAVDKLSAQGILVAVAAGNAGPDSIGSPGSADSALTVGAVDGKDRLADFSSTGPRVGDGAVKPDVTAPGVDVTAASAKGSAIAAEVGEKPAGYTTISGTSMATPHVAGAAALLKQQHPDWGPAELKGALTASAKGGAYTPFQQGAGRIQVDRAIRQTLIAEPASLAFGVQQWPHTDDEPVTRNLTYRNLGTEDVTLKLTSTATDPKGRPAPAGFFTLGAATVTVPAGGTASVPFTADTRLGGTVHGAYGAYVVATGGGQTVRTAASVHREAESYDVTVRAVGPDGKPAAEHLTDLTGYTGEAKNRRYAVPAEADGTTTVRVPKGTYLLDSWTVKDPETFRGGIDWVVQPRLDVTRDTTVTVDARTTRAADIRVPDTKARPATATVSYSHDTSGALIGFAGASFADVRMAHLGPEAPGGIQQTWNGQWTKGANTEYHVATSARVQKIQAAKKRHFTARELATVTLGLGASAPGRTGGVDTIGLLADDVVFGELIEQKLPGSRTLHLSTGDRARWAFDFEQHAGTDAQGLPVVEAAYSLGGERTYKAGKKYAHSVNRAVFGPALDEDSGLSREGNTLYGYVPMLVDGARNPGGSRTTSSLTQLYRDGRRIGTTRDPLSEGVEFGVPSGDAEYRLTTSLKRSTRVAGVSTRVDASWTFRSKKVTRPAALPLSTVRFGAVTAADSTVVAGRTAKVPVSVEGAARGRNLRSLVVHVSYDGGRTWKKAAVTKGAITVRNPAKGRSVSFRAKVTDTRGTVSTVAIHHAYHGR